MPASHSSLNSAPSTSPNQHPSLDPLPTDISISPLAKDSSIRTSRSPMVSHRKSISQDLRGPPSSPRSQRQGSAGMQALQTFYHNPPVANKGSNIFEGRDWKTIEVGEIIDAGEVHFAEIDTSVEDATNLLITTGAPNVVLIRENARSRAAIGTFDYTDLNTYLLLVVGLAKPDEGHISSFNELARKGREGKIIPLRDIKDIGRKEEFLTLPHTANLTHAVAAFASGIHRIIVTTEGTMDVVGVLTQLRLVRFFWENGRNFPAIDTLYPSTLKELNIGSHTVTSINGDRPLTDALEMMNKESITSLPVVDNNQNVVGNISHIDVRLLTKSTSLPLLRSSCIHFISVILSERGMSDGQDSVPVFYVNPCSTLAHTVAKLVATRSHRMWIVDAQSTASPSSSTSTTSTPQITAPATFTPMVLTAQPHSPSPPSSTSTIQQHPSHYSGATAVSASSLPGQHMSGRLSGVISLTDVLNLFARAGGLSPQEPDEARRRRRGSSSSSLRVSIDSARSSSQGLSRSGSVSGLRR